MVHGQAILLVFVLFTCW